MLTSLLIIPLLGILALSSMADESEKEFSLPSPVYPDSKAASQSKIEKLIEKQIENPGKRDNDPGKENQILRAESQTRIKQITLFVALLNFVVSLLL